MAKRYPSQLVTFFAVYHCSYFMGSPTRYVKVIFPEMKEAEEWVESHRDSLSTYSKFMIEEINCRMKAWDGTVPAAA